MVGKSRVTAWRVHDPCESASISRQCMMCLCFAEQVQWPWQHAHTVSRNALGLYKHCITDGIIIFAVRYIA